MHYCVFETERGLVALLGSEGKLAQSTLPQASRELALAELNAGLADGYIEDEAAFGNLPGRLRGYFAGRKADFADVALDLSGYGPFHADVLRAAQPIPYGQTVTYGDLARSAGSQRAARAAGSAMAGNRFPVIVPCHRVIAAGGRIGGFASGLEWKRSLLNLEGVDI